eukprot:350954-Chlamydomonas_euryale.AAC.4
MRWTGGGSARLPSQLLERRRQRYVMVDGPTLVTVMVMVSCMAPKACQNCLVSAASPALTCGCHAGSGGARTAVVAFGAGAGIGSAWQLCSQEVRRACVQNGWTAWHACNNTCDKCMKDPIGCGRLGKQSNRPCTCMGQPGSLVMHASARVSCDACVSQGLL